MAEGTSESMPGETKEEEPFKTIPMKRKRKREKMEDMETTEGSKRPSFPPAKPETLMVLTVFFLPRVLFTEWTFSTLMKAFFDNGFNPFNCRMERWSPEKYLCHHIGTLLSRKTG